jgi:hypothetical protein
MMIDYIIPVVIYHSHRESGCSIAIWGKMSLPLSSPPILPYIGPIHKRIPTPPLFLC